MMNDIVAFGGDVQDLCTFNAKILSANDHEAIRASGLLEEGGTNAFGVSLKDGTLSLPVGGYMGDDIRYSYYGGTSLNLLTMQLAYAMANPEIKRVFLDFSSAGGNSTGVEQTARYINEMQKTKPIIAVVTNALSAAYWLASACTKVYATGETARFGSIGTLLVAVDGTERNAKDGEDVLEVASGALKTLGSYNRKRSPEDVVLLQASVLKTNEVFLSAIGKFRGQEVASVARAADGAVFMASEALTKGFLDGIFTREEIFNMNDIKQEEEKVPVAPTAPITLAADTSAELTATVKTLQERLAVFETQAVAASAQLATQECQNLYAKAFAREATPEEVKEFTALAPEARQTVAKMLTTNPLNEKKQELVGEQANGSNLVSKKSTLVDTLSALYKEIK